MKNQPIGNQPKKDNLSYGKEIISDFLKLNNFKNIELKIDFALDCRGQFLAGRNYCFVKLNINKTKSPVAIPNQYSWSFTGYKADITPAGVLAHEIGHYVDWLHSWKLSANFSWGRTKAISSYEPSKAESFAETMRLFILNPDLLKHSSPERYYYLIKSGLKPLPLGDWDKVLMNAHPKMITAARNWIKK